MTIRSLPGIVAHRSPVTDCIPSLGVNPPRLPFPSILAHPQFGHRLHPLPRDRTTAAEGKHVGSFHPLPRGQTTITIRSLPTFVAHRSPVTGCIPSLGVNPPQLLILSRSD